MDNTEKNNTEKIFNRQYERMKGELLAINMPQGYLTIISKYWDFCKTDVLGIRSSEYAGKDNEKDNYRR